MGRFDCCERYFRGARLHSSGVLKWGTPIYLSSQWSNCLYIHIYKYTYIHIYNHRPLSSPGKTRPGFQTASRICQMHSNALICHYLFLIFPYLLLFFLICHYFTGISISLICPYLLLFSLICNCMYNCLGTFHSMGETAAALVLAG